VTLTWNPADFASSTGGVPDKVTDCVKVNGIVGTSLSGEFKPGPAAGSAQFSYTVPDQPGAQICDRGAVGSATVNTEKSAVLCYTIAAGAVLPEARVTFLLPVSGVIVLALYAAWRRRAGPHHRA
jgi:hypothetical protein